MTSYSVVNGSMGGTPLILLQSRPGRYKVSEMITLMVVTSYFALYPPNVQSNGPLQASLWVVVHVIILV